MKHLSFNTIFTLAILVILVTAGYFSLPWTLRPNMNTSQTNITQMANPASVNCVQKGGQVDIRTGSDGGQVGYCVFSDKSQCEEWALFRGECLPGTKPSSGEVSNIPVDWSTATIPDLHITFRYPSGWTVVSNSPNNIPGVMLGPAPHPVDGPWGIFIYDASNKSVENLIQSIGSQFSDRIVHRQRVTVGGKSATQVTVTTPTIPNWYSESLIIEHGGKVYHLTNGAVRDDNFSKFYQSFNFLD